MPNPWLNEHKSTAAMNYFLNIILELHQFMMFDTLLHNIFDLWIKNLNWKYLYIYCSNFRYDCMKFFFN
jgi:hypothetical protein